MTPHDDPTDGFSVVIDAAHQSPVPAEVVSDRRSSWIHRLAFVAFGLLILFFSINGYIQSARNGERLNRAIHDRSILIRTGGDQSALLAQQEHFIATLERIVTRQAESLRQAGLDNQILTRPSPEPGLSPRPYKTSDPDPRPSPTPAPSEAAEGSPKPTRDPSPSPHPSPTRTCLPVAPVCYSRLIPLFTSKGLVR